MDNREKAQFERLYETHERDIIRYIGFRIAEAAAVEDIAAQTFLKLWENLLKGEAISNPRALLYTIARGLIIDEYRKRGRRQDVALIDVDESVLIDETDPTAGVDNTLTHKKVLSVIRELKPEYQDIIGMHYIDDISIRDIAGIMNEEENTIRVRLHRALSAVRKHFNV